MKLNCLIKNSIILTVFLILLLNFLSIVHLEKYLFQENNQEINIVNVNNVEFDFKKVYKQIYASFKNTATTYCSAEPLIKKNNIKIEQPSVLFDPFQNNELIRFTNKNKNYQQINGRFKPVNCLARHRLAIIIPYKDRLSQLKIFLNHMHPFLQNQQLDYQIYVVYLIK